MEYVNLKDKFLIFFSGRKIMYELFIKVWPTELKRKIVYTLFKEIICSIKLF